MENIERRALLGDRLAQDECTRIGIVLPCPWCNGEMEICHGDNYGYYKTKCVLCGAESPEQPNEWSAISQSNTRPAPPVGRCKDCSYGHPSETEGCVVCVSYGCTVENDNFCKQFEPKEEPNNERL